MQIELRISTKVQAGGKIVINHPQLPPGEKVEVIILLSEQNIEKRRSVVDILEEARGHRLFRTAEEVEDYLIKERESWEN